MSVQLLVVQLYTYVWTVKAKDGGFEISAARYEAKRKVTADDTGIDLVPLSPLPPMPSELVDLLTVMRRHERNEDVLGGRTT